MLDFEFPFLCGLCADVFVALALAVILRYRCSSRVEPASLRVRRVAKMAELMNPTLLSPGSRIVVSYPGELDRFFERILGRPVGDWTCWVSIGGDSRLILEDLGNVSGLYDITEQSGYPRSVVNVE